MKPTIDLSPDIYQKIKTLLQQWVPEAEVWAFGSRVNGFAHEASDDCRPENL